MKKNIYNLIEKNELSIAVIGLGYVGLPLAIEFGKKFNTVGFDINSSRISELIQQYDKTREVSKEEFLLSKLISFSDKVNSIQNRDIFIITVPTPVDERNSPDLNFLKSATKMVAKYIQPDSIIIYESTVYPGCTEEICVPILEKTSGLKYNIDFYCGYSPERINPGDREHKITKIKKVVSGSTIKIGRIIDKLYARIIDAGIYLASSIKVAEAAKVIENTQRDINIAFMNELALVFDRMELDTNEVLKAAGTKWNFLNFKPGLVGGHCIGVDPYYLASKAQALGHHPEMLLAGRRINDSMGKFIARKVIKLMIHKDLKVRGSNVLILGITFKENCPDIRNTGVIDILNELKDFGCKVDVFDPHADKNEVKEKYSFDLIDKIEIGMYQAVVLAVAHNEFSEFPYQDHNCEGGIIFDIKGLWSQNSKVNRL